MISLRSLLYFMRGMVFTVLVLLSPTLGVAQETQSSRSPQPHNQLPAPTAEPENPSAYAPPVPKERVGPTMEDFGPARQHYVIANQTDNLEQSDDPPRFGHLPKEKITLDPRVKISKIHDVENDSNYRGGEKSRTFVRDQIHQLGSGHPGTN